MKSSAKSDSVLEAFRRNRDTRPNSPAFLIAAGDRSVPISWRQFAHDVDCIAWVIRSFTPGATVGLLGENSYEWITAHAAALFAGAVVVPLETTLTPAEIAERLAFTGARALVHSALYAEKARAAGSLLAGLIVAGFGSHESDAMLARASDALDSGAAPSVFDLPPREEDETAMIVFTSGTTSKPRGAELTLAGLRAFADFSSRRLPMKPGDRSLMLLPLHHIFGMSATYLMLMRGVALGVCPDFRRIFDAVARFRADFLCLVPALAEILAAKIAQHGRSAEEVFGSPIEWVLSGGAPLARRTHEQLTALGMRVQQIYGLTETTALYAMSPHEDPRPGTVGLACGGTAGMETRVSDGGELLIRGPAVMTRYYKDPERTATAFYDGGWFRTGDFGAIDADGYVTITGRASRTIVLSSGKKVAPEELEERILAVPGVREVVVSGDGETRELVAEVYAVVSEDTVRRQIDSLNRQLPVHKRIRRVVARQDPFPRTASGKIRVDAPTPVSPSRPAAVRVAPKPAIHESPTTRHEPRIASREPPTTNHEPRITSHDSGVRRRAAVWSLAAAATAAMVLVVHLLPHLVRGANVPSVVRSLFEFFEESGEIVLAVFAIGAFLVSRKFLSRSDNSDTRTTNREPRATKP